MKSPSMASVFALNRYINAPFAIHQPSNIQTPSIGRWVLFALQLLRPGNATLTDETFHYLQDRVPKRANIEAPQVAQ